jgi:hypothetical protein
MKTINFVAIDDHGWSVQPRPTPASKNVPDWWKSVPPYFHLDDRNNKSFNLFGGIANATFKKCVPMLDALVSGYIIHLWSDVQIVQEANGPSIKWRVSKDVFSQHGALSGLVESPAGYSSDVFKYHNAWNPRTPSGYSVMVTQPFGYRDTPFHAVPGIVDSDKDSPSMLLPPVWIKEGFEGIVEKGTPIAQVIPFKRESWKAEFSSLSPGELQKLEDKHFNSTLINHYIKNIWSKKEYL